MRGVGLAVAAITAAGLALRLFALGHGLPYQYVPDESTMVGGALRMGATKSLQPSTFIYPAVLMYTFAAEYLGLLVVGRLGGLFASVEQFREYAFLDPTLFYLLPRLAIALAGTGTIPLTYVLGRRLYGSWAGLVAAALIATSLMDVQMSHQARHWAPVTLLALAVLWVALDLARHGQRRDYLLSGLLVGLTAATSFNGFLLFLLPLAAHVQHVRRRVRDLSGKKNGEKGGLGTPQTPPGAAPWTRPRPHLWIALAGVLALAVFFALNPYILLQADRFAAFHTGGDASIGGQIRGHYDNYLQQFLDKQGFGFFAEATLAYEPAITLLGLAGALLAVRQFPSTALLVLLYPLFHYFMFATTAPSLEQRYMLPAIGLWALPAGLAGQRMLTWLQDLTVPGQPHRGQTSPPAPLPRGEGSEAPSSPPSPAGKGAGGRGLPLLLLALVALPSLRYDWVLSQTDTRTLAKTWIEANIPAGSDLVVESYPPPVAATLESLRAQQAAAPGSLGARDQWVLERGVAAAGETGYNVTRLNLVDTHPEVDNVSPYLAAHRHRYFVVTDFRWKSDHRGHEALKAFLVGNGRLLERFSPSQSGAYVPSDLLNNLEDPFLELWRVERPGPNVEIYEVPE